ncbi:lipid A deacylase LpxR family protein [Marilutibacter chinensis]|uniref:Lipid A deacylase LpxR family protein n=1 Tax=Marilutibacter chinensis TaxID=2912247 RepID=A0ABS9HN34_9GAMM|nr:lipid A deacylase LpxR family protein [Lysobacter chinensis]MCF7220420.1 lipid A deacylase LpxR family protein [Lysobacter chinensis]
MIRLHPLWLLAIASISMLVAAGDAAAQGREGCRHGSTRLPPIVNFRVDNDLFGGQDQGYSNGVQLTLVSPNLRDYTGDPCLPPLAHWVNRHLEALQPARFEQQNMIATFAQGIFTPTDFSRSELIEDDRPYAAALLVGLGYNAREGDRLRTTQLQAGIVGPAALGEQVQDAVHGITGSEKFRGWDNQLENEPVVRLIHERMHRVSANHDGDPGWSWDAIGHYGGSLGNLATYANVGGEFRFGRNLPDDFGSTPLRPAGENTAPTREPQSQYPGGFHLFLSMDARWVLHDITLDGNLFRDSHRVDRRPLVAYAGYGVALMYHRWKFALARYHSTREFEEQAETPVFGSFTVSRAF